VRIADSSVFRASKTVAVALVEVEPGGMRELHWHPNVDEWQYYIEGQGRMGVFGAQGSARTPRIAANLSVGRNITENGKMSRQISRYSPKPGDSI
jgi:oxalate decarboxylase/phosphoglucose isomerase-like protein (cupin superfamily)